MLKTIALALSLATLPACSACGYSSTNNELTGQVKKVVKRTPILCPDYNEADLSLGVLRNGVGSISKEDLLLTVVNESDLAILKKAAEDGAIVKVTYDDYRVRVCVPEPQLTSVTVIEVPGGGSAQ